MEWLKKLIIISVDKVIVVLTFVQKHLERMLLKNPDDNAYTSYKINHVLSVELINSFTIITIHNYNIVQIR